jgi:tetratricopeptide (TPR) repeat protein
MMQRAVLSACFLTISLFVGSVCASGEDKPQTEKTAAAEMPAKSGTPQAVPSAVGPTPLAHALELYRTGKVAEARAEYEILTKAGGADAAAAYAGLARVYLKEKRVTEANAASARALELAPTLPAAHSARGEVYFRQGKLAEAEQEFLAPLRANQADARAYYGLTRICWVTSNNKLAKTRLEKAHQLGDSG